MTVLDRKLIPIPHWINEDTSIIQKFRGYLTRVARDASPKQSYYPLQSPALRIHSFPNEESFVRLGGELYDELMADPKQIVLMAASAAPQMVRWCLHWSSHSDRIAQVTLITRRLFEAYSRALSDPQVLRDRNRLSETMHILLRGVDEEALQRVLVGMINWDDELLRDSGLEPGRFHEMISKILNLKRRMKDVSDRLHVPWSKEQGHGMSLEEKEKRLNIFMKIWDRIVMDELVPREENPDRRYNGRNPFWRCFSVFLTLKWNGIVSIGDLEGMMVRESISLWKAINFFLDPSYSLNVLLVGSLDLNQTLMRNKCLGLGYSWKALKRSLQWIDYDDVLESRYEIVEDSE